MNHLGYEWNARQWAIFNDLYNDTAYAYVKTAWDAENAEPDLTTAPSRTPSSTSRAGVDQPENSTRVDDFYSALQATTAADCAADTAAHPERQCHGAPDRLAALEAEDRSRHPREPPLRRRS